MDTILNVGITKHNLPELVEAYGERLAYDCYRRLLRMYGEIVEGIDPDIYRLRLSGILSSSGVETESALSVTGLKALVGCYEEIYEEQVGNPFPASYEEQLEASIAAVFKSWNTPRAIAYRNANDIPHDMGTAVTIQAMVFGNRDEKSASGVLFSRDPSTGEPELVGEFLPNAQGEDVVAGTHTPKPLIEIDPQIYQQLDQVAVELENRYTDMQDIEFTVESGELFILQCRTGKRTAKAAFRIAKDLLDGGAITHQTAISRLSAEEFLSLQGLAITEAPEPTYTGIGASVGVAHGVAAFCVEDMTDPGVDYILVANETTPDDFPAMLKSVGILTMTGGLTSHAAVVGRSMGLVCVVGVTDLELASVNLGSSIVLSGEDGNVWVNENITLELSDLPLDELASLFPVIGAYSEDLQ